MSASWPGLRRVLRIATGWSAERDVDSEIDFHLESRAHELMGRGLDAKDARAAAEREFGDVAEARHILTGVVRRREQRVRRATWWEAFGQDLAFGARALRRSPGVTLTVVLVLALGLGANAALFAVLDQIFLRAPTGIQAPQEIRRLYYYRPPGEVRAVGPLSSVYETAMYPEYAAIRATADAKTRVAAYVRPDSVDMYVDNAIVSTMRSYVTQSYFTTLGVRPARGRFFTDDEDRVDIASPAAVISDALWQRAFSGAPSVLGRQLRIAGRTYSVVGVAPPGFSGIDLDRADLWLSLGALPTPPFFSRPWYLGGYGVFRVFARIPSSAAEQNVTAAATLAYRGVHQNEGVRDSTSTVIAGPVVAALGPSDRKQEVSVSLRLAGVSLMLLLIAIGNVTNLLLVRGLRRRREVAIRRALGMSTVRLCRQLMSESLLLSTLGAGVAVVIGLWGAMTLRALLLPEIHWSSDSHIARLVAFTALASVAAGTVAGMAPAFHAARLDATTGMRIDLGSSVPKRGWTRNALMIGQVALSVVLLIGAGLFVRSLRNVRAIDLGFDSRGLITIRAPLSDPARNRAVGTALESLAPEVLRLPDVTRVAVASVAPMQGAYSTSLFLPGRDSIPRIDGAAPFVLPVSPEYFSTVSVRVVAGRTFTSSDRGGTALVAVVSQTFARTVWPGENPLGKCIRTIERTARCTTVVGVVEDTHALGVIEPKRFMQLYLPLAQTARLDADRFSPWSNRVLLVRTRPGTESVVVPLMLRLLRERLPGIDALRVREMAQVLEPELRPWRLGATLFSALGLLAVLVAVVGMYSVIAYATSQRAHEMSVRMALGARAWDILTLVVNDGLRVVVVSIVIGIGAAVSMGRLIESLLYGVSTRDPLVLVGASGLLGLVGLAAIVVPALHAARSDPASALRAE